MKKYYFFLVLISLTSNNSLLPMLSTIILKKTSKNFFKQKKNKRFNHGHYYQDNERTEKKDFYDRYSGIILGSYLSLCGFPLFLFPYLYEHERLRCVDKKIIHNIEKENSEQKKEIEELKKELEHYKDVKIPADKLADKQKRRKFSACITTYSLGKNK